MLWWSTIVLTALTLTCAENVPKRASKRSYVCPPDFVRLSNKCYFFSTNTATWQDAYWKCSDMHSNLATIRSPYQDKILRRLLDKSAALSERWIGGRYDWEQMTWQWAASGKTIDYKGFIGPQATDKTDKEFMRWHCIILNPRLHYRWDHRSCLEKKYYICQTKIKNVSRKGKKKLERQYNATKYKKLNEVPVPDIPEILDNNVHVKSNLTLQAQHNLDNNELSNTAFAHSPKALKKKKRRKGKGRKGKGKKKNRKNKERKDYNPVLQDAPHVKEGDLTLGENMTNKEGSRSAGRLSWKTYYKATISPLHPRGIVEEFSYT